MVLQHSFIFIYLILCCCQVFFGVVLEVFGQQAPDLSQIQSGGDFAPAQYHIQTDLGDDRFFRFQTTSGQFRKERLNAEGAQIGSYGWVDPNGVLRLYDYKADHEGYRIEQERLFKVGAPSPGVTLKTNGGTLQFGFEVFPLDGGAGPSFSNRVGGGNEARIHVPEGNFGAVQSYQVDSLTSTNHHLKPNPLTKHEGATFFSGTPFQPPPTPAPRIVVGAEAGALPAVEAEQGFVVGHAGATRNPAPRQQAPRRGIVIGLSHGQVSVQKPLPPRQTAPRSLGRNVIVIGQGSRRRRMLF